MDITLTLGEILNLNQTLKAVIDDNKAKVDPLFKFKLLGIRKPEGPMVKTQSNSLTIV